MIRNYHSIDIRNKSKNIDNFDNSLIFCYICILMQPFFFNRQSTNNIN